MPKARSAGKYHTAGRYWKPGRRRGGFVAIPIAGSVALGTLGDNAVITVGSSGSYGEDLFIISVDLSASIRGLTAGEGDPMTLTISHSDYSDAEVQEALDVTLVDPDDKIEQERARRLVRKVGVFQQEGQMDDTFTALRALGRNGNPVMRQKCRFSIGDGFTLDIGVWNRSGGALQTGAQLEFDGTVYGRWQR